MGLISRILLVLAFALPAHAQEKFITVASTTSTEQSGLFKHLLPVFEKKTGIQVRVVALGTGQALDMGRRGDADVVFVHDLVAEEKFLAEGFGVQRFDVMYNDFVLVGPKSDPAGVSGGKNILEALIKIRKSHHNTQRINTRPIGLRELQIGLQNQLIRLCVVLAVVRQVAYQGGMSHDTLKHE